MDTHACRITAQHQDQNAGCDAFAAVEEVEPVSEESSSATFTARLADRVAARTLKLGTNLEKFTTAGGTG